MGLSEMSDTRPGPGDSSIYPAISTRSVIPPLVSLPSSFSILVYRGCLTTLFFSLRLFVLSVIPYCPVEAYTISTYYAIDNLRPSGLSRNWFSEFLLSLSFFSNLSESFTMKFLTTVLGLASAANAHTLFTTLFIDGENQGDGTCVRQPKDDSTANSPIYPIDGAAMACGMYISCTKRV